MVDRPSVEKVPAAQGSVEGNEEEQKILHLQATF